MEKNIKTEKKTIGDVESVISENDPVGWGIRHVQTVMLFGCLVIAYALRVNLSVGIVAMVNKNETNPDFEEFNWDTSQQSIILSSFFWGYTLNQIPAGQLAHHFGPRLLLGIAMGACSILNLFTPIAASVGDWQLLCALRVLQGLAQSFVFPCTHTMLSKWAPPSERGRLTTTVYAGAQLGTVLMLAVSGVLASSFMGWPSIFYFSGASGAVWTVFWFFFGHNSPAEHHSISSKEKDFIENSLGTKEHSTKLRTPWKSIFTSIPFLALIMVHCGHNWGFWTLLTNIPTYMQNVLHLDIQKNALLSALPYLVMWLLSFVFSFISDTLVNKNVLSAETSRKLYNSIGHYGPMITLIGLGYVTEENSTLAIVLLTIAVGINSGTLVGYVVNHMDLSTNYAGTLMGISNFFSNIMGIVAPLMVGLIVHDETDPAQWRIIFFITAGFYFVGNTIFVIFGKAEIQKWNYPMTS